MKGKYGMWMFVIVAVLCLAGCAQALPAAPQPSVAAAVPPAVVEAHPPLPRPAIDMQPCPTDTLHASCGTLTVFENRAARAGRTIGIRVTVVPAKGPDPAPDPIFWLAGGPGAAANDDLGFALMLLGPANERRDLVFVDQRGTGASHRLTCSTAAFDISSEGDARGAADLQTCLSQLDGDPAAYTTAWGMDDLDDVRAALGYDRINLYGGSYGPTAAQVYILRHGEHVRTSTMTGASLLEVPMFERLPANSQHTLDVIFSRCEADPACQAAYPGVRAEFAGLVDRMARGPIDLPLADPVTGRPVRLTRSAFAVGIHQKLLYDIQKHAILPQLVHAVYTGDLAPIASMVDTSGEADPASVWQMMNATILCFEDWAMMRRTATEQLAAGTFMRYEDVRAITVPEGLCAALPRPQPEALYGPLAPSDVPILFLTGEADANDPEANVATAKQRYPNSLVLVAPGQAHNYTGFSCRSNIIAAFVESGTTQGLDGGCLAEVPLPPFNIGR